MNNFRWDSSFLVDFDVETGVSKTAERVYKTLSVSDEKYVL